MEIVTESDLINLRNLIFEKSFCKAQNPIFTLSSGAKSCYYFNLKKVTYDYQGLNLVGRCVLGLIQKLKEINDWTVHSIGGLTLGADPIALSTICFSSFDYNDDNISAFTIRKEEKDYGTKSQIEGCVYKGDNVIILEDVVTTGASTIRAIEVARKHNLNVLCAISLVDRCEEFGKYNIEKLGIKLHSLFTINDFIL